MHNKDVAVEAVSKLWVANTYRARPIGVLCLMMSVQMTGSGKTLAFVIPVVEILLRRSAALYSHQLIYCLARPLIALECCNMNKYQH